MTLFTHVLNGSFTNQTSPVHPMWSASQESVSLGSHLQPFDTNWGQRHDENAHILRIKDLSSSHWWVSCVPCTGLFSHIKRSSALKVFYVPHDQSQDQSFVSDRKLVLQGRTLRGKQWEIKVYLIHKYSCQLWMRIEKLNLIAVTHHVTGARSAGSMCS